MSHPAGQKMHNSIQRRRTYSVSGVPTGFAANMLISLMAMTSVMTHPHGGSNKSAVAVANSTSHNTYTNTSSNNNSSVSSFGSNNSTVSNKSGNATTSTAATTFTLHTTTTTRPQPRNTVVSTCPPWNENQTTARLCSNGPAFVMCGLNTHVTYRNAACAVCQHDHFIRSGACNYGMTASGIIIVCLVAIFGGISLVFVIYTCLTDPAVCTGLKRRCSFCGSREYAGRKRQCEDQHHHHHMNNSMFNMGGGAAEQFPDDIAHTGIVNPAYQDNGQQQPAVTSTTVAAASTPDPAYAGTSFWRLSTSNLEGTASAEAEATEQLQRQQLSPMTLLSPTLSSSSSGDSRGEDYMIVEAARRGVE